MRIALVVALAVGACGVPDATLVDGSINGTIGGTVTGMVGTGLVLQNLGGDNAAVTADGTFVFARPIATGMSYSVTVQTQPSAPSQTCTVTNGTGIVGGSDVTNVSVTCTTEPFKISGSVTGLLGSGLVLANNTGDDLAIAADGAFSFAHGVPSGSSYAVTVKTQPSAPSQTCTVVGGLGTVEIERAHV